MNFNINASNKDTATIDILGEIGYWFTDNTFLGIKRKIETLTAKKIVLNISSLGGAAFEGLAIYDLLKTTNAEITARIYGATASAGTIVAMGANTIEMYENAFFLIHHSWSDISGNASDLRELADQLDVIDNRMIEIYRKKTGKPKSEIKELMYQERWLDSTEAKNFGLIDKIIQTTKAAALVDVNKINNSYLPKLNINIKNDRKMNETNLLAELEITKSKLSAAEAKSQQFESAVKAEQALTSTYKQQADELAAKNAELETALNAKANTDQEVIALKVELQMLKQKAESTEQVLTSKEATIQTLQRELNTANEQRTKMIAELHKAQAGKGYNAKGDHITELDNLSPNAKAVIERAKQYKF